jgi:hypothetical protein
MACCTTEGILSSPRALRTSLEPRQTTYIGNVQASLPTRYPVTMHNKKLQAGPFLSSPKNPFRLLASFKPSVLKSSMSQRGTEVGTFSTNGMVIYNSSKNTSMSIPPPWRLEAVPYSGKRKSYMYNVLKHIYSSYVVPYLCIMTDSESHQDSRKSASLQIDSWPQLVFMF